MLLSNGTYKWDRTQSYNMSEQLRFAGLVERPSSGFLLVLKFKLNLPTAVTEP